jgi:TolA-binding protein
MANKVRNQPGTTTTASGRKVSVQEPNPLDNVLAIYEKNKKAISTTVTIVLVVIVGYFAYTKLYKGPEEEKASAAMFYPQQYFAADSLNMALEGDGKNAGFIKIGKKFSGTAAGNLAHYYEGLCYMKMGKFKEATVALKEFNGKGTSLGNMAQGVLGEAYMESGESAKAIDCFKKAIEDKEDNVVTPMYLYQLGLAYDLTNKKDDAKTAFKRIRDEYPKSMQARDMDKELARLGELN